MKLTNLDAEQRKQLVEFYKAMKVAAKIFPKGGKQVALVQLADQIIAELKKEVPDENKIQELADKLQSMTSLAS